MINCFSPISATNQQGFPTKPSPGFKREHRTGARASLNLDEQQQKTTSASTSVSLNRKRRPPFTQGDRRRRLDRTGCSCCLLLASMSSVLTHQVKKLRSAQTGFLDWNPLPSQHLWDAVTFTRTKISEECFRSSRNTSSDWDGGQAAGCPSPHQNIPRTGGCFSQQQDTTHHSKLRDF